MALEAVDGWAESYSCFTANSAASVCKQW